MHNWAKAITLRAYTGSRRHARRRQLQRVASVLDQLGVQRRRSRSGNGRGRQPTSPLVIRRYYRGGSTVGVDRGRVQRGVGLQRDLA